MPVPPHILWLRIFGLPGTPFDARTMFVGGTLCFCATACNVQYFPIADCVSGVFIFCLLIFTACIRLTVPNAFYTVSKEKRAISHDILNFSARVLVTDDIKIQKGRRAPLFLGCRAGPASLHFDRAYTFRHAVVMQAVDEASRNAKTLKLHS
jgi:hypothetical protein